MLIYYRASRTFHLFIIYCYVGFRNSWIQVLPLWHWNLTLPHLPALPHPALGFSLGSMGGLWERQAFPLVMVRWYSPPRLPLLQFYFG